MADPEPGAPEEITELVIHEEEVLEHLALMAIKELMQVAHGDDLAAPLAQTAGMMRDPRRGPELNRRATYVGTAANLLGGISMLIACLDAAKQAAKDRIATDGENEPSVLVPVD